MKKIIGLMLVLIGCASVPSASPIDGEKFFVVQATNDGAYTVAVSLNGAKIGELQAWGKATFFVRESALRGGRCAQVSASVILQGGRTQSDEQCIEQGGYFTLQLDNQSRLWLVPRRGK